MKVEETRGRLKIFGRPDDPDLHFMQKYAEKRNAGKVVQRKAWYETLRRKCVSLFARFGKRAKQ